MPKPFGEDDEEEIMPSQKVGLKKVSSQKSIFDSIPKKPTQDQLDQNVKGIQERASQYKSRTAELATQFIKTLADKTLQQNKNQFQNEIESELLRNMVRLAQEINADIAERDGEGSLSWITLLLKTCFNQRDKINRLEYSISQLEKKTDPAHLSELINTVLDSKKKSE
jgi:hypothetical protein